MHTQLSQVENFSFIMSSSTNQTQQRFKALCKLEECVVFRVKENDASHFRIYKVENKLTFFFMWFCWNTNDVINAVFFGLIVFIIFFIYSFGIIFFLNNVKNDDITLIDQQRESLLKFSNRKEHNWIGLTKILLEHFFWSATDISNQLIRLKKRKKNKNYIQFFCKS